MIILEDVSKSFTIYSQKLKVLDSINLTVEDGSFIVITAPSGSGKTTLLNVIAGLLRPDSGRVLINNIDITKLDEESLAALRADLIGFVFQEYNLISTFTALENILFPMEIGQEELNVKQAEKLLELVDLKDRETHFPHQLSGGEKQRLAFARALANDPPILLVDEPTGNLDQYNASLIYKLLDDLKMKNKTIIVATHDSEIIRRADRCYTMKNGRLFENDSP